MKTEHPTRFRAGLVQLRASRILADNLESAEALIRAAAKGGADYIQTPENTALMELEPALVLSQVQPEAQSVPLARFRALAAELGIWLHLGSLGIKVDQARIANRSFLIDPKGAITARYDKLHMFDVDLPGGESYRESDSYDAGTKGVVAALSPGGCPVQLGMTICYDLRFPGLYRALAMAGATMIAIPAAFTKQTGAAHWHALVRARAIETCCYVLAASQGGLHENGRETFGHTMIVSPWGDILAEAGEDPGVIFADIDLARVHDMRSRIPSLRHGRHFEVENIGDHDDMGDQTAS